MKKYVFLVSENETYIQFAQSVSEACSAKLANSGTLHGLNGLEDSDSLSAIFLHAGDNTILDHFESRFGGKFDSRKVHVIVPFGKRAAVEELVDYDDIGHVILANFSKEQPPDVTGRRYAHFVNASLRKKFEGLSSILPAGAEIISKVITESLQKRFVVEALNTQLTKRKWNPKMAAMVANALDEMIMNAVFDAPVDQQGRQIYQTTPRSANLQLDNRAKVETQIAIQDDFCAVSVTDQHGSIVRKSLLRHVSQGFAESQNIVRPDHLQGAGLGLALVIKSGGSLAFSCQPGQRTEVVAIFGRTASFAQFKNQFQFISTCFDT